MLDGSSYLAAAAAAAAEKESYNVSKILCT